MKILFAALAFAFASAAAQAQTYPSRPVTIIVPFAPGAGTDVVAREKAPVFAAKLGPSVEI